MHQRGTVFCAHPIGRSPQANAGFGNGARGELQRRNGNFPKTENTVDFRERVSRSIWPSKLGLSCDRILPERGILFFGGEVSVRGMFLPAGEIFLPEKLPFRCVCKRCICWGIFRLEETRKQRSAFSYHLSARGHGWLRRLRNEAWKNLKSASTR